MLESHESRTKYLECYNKVDLALDTFPFSGGTISVEALWMGVPVLTLVGERFVSRQGLQILMNVGLNEWISFNKEEYVSKAINFSRNLDKISTIRKNLRKKLLESPICNARRFSKNFENIFKHCCTDCICSHARNGGSFEPRCCRWEIKRRTAVSSKSSGHCQRWQRRTCRPRRFRSSSAQVPTSTMCRPQWT